MVGGRVDYQGGCYDTWIVKDANDRVWKAVSDASLGNRNKSAEVVTPILKIEDIETLQKVVRALRAAGAKVSQNAGQHIHVGAKDLTPAQIANLVKLFYKQEELILKAVGTWENRMYYTKPTDRRFITKIKESKPENMDALNVAWFGQFNGCPDHYDSHRYRALNLNNLWGHKHTIEFRFFNSTTHAGEVKANIHLALALVNKAKDAKAASAKNQREYKEESAKYDTRVFLLRLGLIGEAFKSTRLHLLKRLPGSSAWKHGRPS